MSLSFTLITGFYSEILAVLLPPVFFRGGFFLVIYITSDYKLRKRSLVPSERLSALASYFLRWFIGDQLSHYLNVVFIANIEISTFCQKTSFPAENTSELFQEIYALSLVRSCLFPSFNPCSSARMVRDQALFNCVRVWQNRETVLNVAFQDGNYSVQTNCYCFIDYHRHSFSCLLGMP